MMMGIAFFFTFILACLCFVLYLAARRQLDFERGGGKDTLGVDSGAKINQSELVRLRTEAVMEANALTERVTELETLLKDATDGLAMWCSPTNDLLLYLRKELVKKTIRQAEQNTQLNCQLDYTQEGQGDPNYSRVSTTAQGTVADVQAGKPYVTAQDDDYSGHEILNGRAEPLPATQAELTLKNAAKVYANSRAIQFDWQIGSLSWSRIMKAYLAGAAFNKEDKK